MAETGHPPAAGHQKPVGSLLGTRVAMVVTNDASSDPRIDKEARALSEAGAEVLVVAWDRSRTHPAEEDRVAYSIRRVGPEARHGGGLGNIGAYRRFWTEATESALSWSPTVVHCHDSDTAPVGLRILRRIPQGCSLVLDLHELYRESKMIPRKGLKGVLAKAAVWRVERSAARRAALVVVANPGQAGLVAGLPSGDPKITVVENAPELTRFVASSDQRTVDTPLRVCFVGQKRTPEHLVDLMEAVDVTPGTHALIAGGGPASEAVAEAAEGRERVDVLGRVDYEEIVRLYSACDVVYAVYDTSVGNYRTHFPVKVMEAMAIGAPAMVAQGTWVGTFVEEQGVGEAVQEHDIEAIASTLARWRDDPGLRREMGMRGRALVEGGLNWERSAERLVSAYVEAVGRSGRMGAP